MSQTSEFYKCRNFIRTQIGKMPEDWDYATIDEISIECKTGIPVRQQDRISGHYPYFGANGIIDFVNDYIFDGEYIIIAQDGSIGAIHYYNGKFWANNHVWVIKVKPSVFTKFVYYALKTLNWKGLASGSTRPKVTQRVLLPANLPLPKSLEEQQKIVLILSELDEALQQTDEIITKTRELKKGLMQRLLTKGIGHTRFKKTEVGEMPEEWEVLKLKDVVLEAKSGFACGKRDEQGIIQLRMNSIDIEGWINKEGYVKVPIPRNAEEYILKHGDILFNNTNSAELIGKTAIFRDEIPRCVYSNHLTRIRVNPSKVISEWILYIFIRNWQLGIFKAIRHQHVHQAGINKVDLLNLRIPVASLSEQQKIVEVLTTVADKTEKERRIKEQLEKTKRWFMQNLLTGRIRIKVN